jgi:hypothetical protein
LFGIVSRGDISRAKKAGKDKVPINRSFTFLKGKQFMRAREIFRAKEKIREISVIEALDGGLYRLDVVYTFKNLNVLCRSMLMTN